MSELDFNSIDRVFRRRLRFFREKLGWSQADLAERSEMSTQFVQLVESGKRFPRPSAIKKLARAIGISETDLFLPEEVLLTPTLAVSAIIEYFYEGKKTLVNQSVKRLNLKRIINDVPESKIHLLEAMARALADPTLDLNEKQVSLAAK